MAFKPSIEALSRDLEQAKSQINYLQSQLKASQEQRTLRDYFAGKALANMASFHAGDAFDPKNVSKAAYQYADAMLQARSKSDG